MIEVEGKIYRTAYQWYRRRRRVLPGVDGLRQEWRHRCINGSVVSSASFFTEDQTRAFNQDELKKIRESEKKQRKERKKRLSCSICGEYYGKDAAYILSGGRCEYCRQNHTAWQWLRYAHCIPVDDAVPTEKRPLHYDDEGCLVHSEKIWYYYEPDQVVPVSRNEFNKLKKLYIEKFGGWEKIDLDHTSYDGRKWW